MIVNSLLIFALSSSFYCWFSVTLTDSFNFRLFGITLFHLFCMARVKINFVLTYQIRLTMEFSGIGVDLHQRCNAGRGVTLQLMITRFSLFNTM